MKILVLGDSDTSASAIEGDSWTAVLREELARSLGRPVDLTDALFVPFGDKAVSVAARRVDEEHPDVVILPVSTWPFQSDGAMWLRVRRLLGRRAGQTFRDVAERFNSVSRDRGRLRHGLNRSVRWLLRRLIGADTVASRDDCTRTLSATLAALSRREQVQAVVVGYAPIGKALTDRKAAREREAFMAELRAESLAHHFRWVEAAEAFEGPDSPSQRTHRDSVHMTPEAQRALGSHVAREVTTHLVNIGDIPPAAGRG